MMFRHKATLGTGALSFAQVKQKTRELERNKTQNVREVIKCWILRLIRQAEHNASLFSQLLWPRLILQITALSFGLFQPFRFSKGNKNQRKDCLSVFFAKARFKALFVVYFQGKKLFSCLDSRIRSKIISFVYVLPSSTNVTPSRGPYLHLCWKQTTSTTYIVHAYTVKRAANVYI